MRGFGDLHRGEAGDGRVDVLIFWLRDVFNF